MTIDELIDGWEAAWSDKDPAAFGEVCAAGIHYEDPLTRAPLNGIEALAQHVQRLWSAFPDARLERHRGRALTDGQFVAAPCKLLGTHREPLEGLPATRRFVVVHCIFYCELQHELLFRVRGFSTSTTPRPSSACCRRAGRSARRRCWCCAASGCALANESGH